MVANSDLWVKKAQPLDKDQQHKPTKETHQKQDLRDKLHYDIFISLEVARGREREREREREKERERQSMGKGVTCEVSTISLSQS